MQNRNALFMRFVDGATNKCKMKCKMKLKFLKKKFNIGIDLYIIWVYTYIRVKEETK